MRLNLRLCGKGGQGIMLSGYILGKAASVFHHYHAVQTQSYGPEARGGAARSEVIIADQEIGYCGIERADAMMVMSQEAYDKYSHDLKDDCIIVADPDLVKRIDHGNVVAVPGTRMAEELGNKIVANIVMLGAFNQAGGFVPPKALEKAVEDSVPSRFTELNLKALKEGIKQAQE